MGFLGVIMTQRFLTPLAARLPATVPFTGPETLERQRGAVFAARLGANESGFGPSPLALEAMRTALGSTWMYADPESHDLKTALALHHGIAADHFVIGGGIDELLGLICRLTLSEGDAVVTSLGGYPTFNFHVAGYGGVLHSVPYRGDFEDIEGLLAMAQRIRPKLVYLANPDNPMGSHLQGHEIEAMIAGLPPESLLILDEAYCDLAPANAVAQVAADHPQVIRMRTFSKGYGMAGARVGYAICHPDLARAFDRIRNHFGLSRVSQIGALAALRDQGYLTEVKGKVAAARVRMGRIAEDCGLRALPSATNFVTVDCGKDGDFARAVLRECLARGLFIRMPGIAPHDRCIRISLGPDAEMDVVAEVLPQALAAARV